MEVLAEILVRIWKIQKEYNELIDPDDETQQRFLDGAIWGMKVLISNSETMQKNTNKKE